MTAAARHPNKPSSRGRPVRVGNVARLLLLLAPAILVAWLLGLRIWPPAMLVALFLLLIPLALTWRWFRFSGSLIFYELLRAGRRGRNVLFRCLYACLLLGVLCSFYMSWSGAPLWKVVVEPTAIPAARMPDFADHFFTSFLTAQLTGVLLVTPIYTAGVIAEEKEHRTLEVLLATQLSGTEIVMSKFVARLATLGVLLLAGLPVLALTQLWGGVDPLLLAGGFAATGATLLSVGSLGILCSVYARSSLEALLWTYLALVGFLAFCACSPCPNFIHPMALFGALPWSGSFPPLIVFTTYTLFHATVAVFCLGVAVGRVREVALSPPAPVPVPARKGGAPAVSRPRRCAPPVQEDALLWKELYVEGAPGRDQDSLLTAIPQALLVYCVGASCLNLLVALLGGERVPGPINLYVRIFGTPQPCWLLLLTAIYAARTVSRERERQTLDSLRSVPQDDAAVLFAKWLGSVGRTRRAWWCVGAVWALGVLTGGLVPLAVPLLALACGVYAGFVSSLGLYFSTVCQTTLRATLATALVVLAVAGVPWVLWDLGPLVLPPGPAGRWLVSFQHDGLTPPMPLWVFAFGYEEVVTDLAAWAGRVLAALAGLACYAAAAWFLWRRALARFRVES
jgi:ABC-type transport system involved in multi-copper enzyme maturation permease subunit